MVRCRAQRRVRARRRGRAGRRPLPRRLRAARRRRAPPQRARRLRAHTCQPLPPQGMIIVYSFIIYTNNFGV